MGMKASQDDMTANFAPVGLPEEVKEGKEQNEQTLAPKEEDEGDDQAEPTLESLQSSFKEFAKSTRRIAEMFGFPFEAPESGCVDCGDRKLGKGTENLCTTMLTKHSALLDYFLVVKRLKGIDSVILQKQWPTVVKDVFKVVNYKVSQHERYLEPLLDIYLKYLLIFERMIAVGFFDYDRQRLQIAFPKAEKELIDQLSSIMKKSRRVQVSRQVLPKSKKKQKVERHAFDRLYQNSVPGMLRPPDQIAKGEPFIRMPEAIPTNPEFMGLKPRGADRLNGVWALKSMDVKGSPVVPRREGTLFYGLDGSVSEMLMQRKQGRKVSGYWTVMSSHTGKYMLHDMGTNSKVVHNIHTQPLAHPDIDVEENPVVRTTVLLEEHLMEQRAGDMVMVWQRVRYEPTTQV